MLITIDPGHGGNKRGAVATHPLSGAEVLEKDLNLALAWELKEQVERQGHIAKLTRDDDYDVDLAERARIGNAGERFVSIHHNSFASADVGGLKIFVARRESEQHKVDFAQALVALSVCRNLTPALLTFGIAPRIPCVRRDDLTYHKRLKVLQELTVPGCLVEVCYMTCPEELRRAMTPPFRMVAARAMAEGLLHFRDDLLEAGKG